MKRLVNDFSSEEFLVKGLTLSAAVCDTVEDEDALEKVARCDFSTVRTLDRRLETGILYPENNPKLSKAIYEKVVDGKKIHLEMITYLEVDEIFLQDGWVVTK